MIDFIIVFIFIVFSFFLVSSFPPKKDNSKTRRRKRRRGFKGGLEGDIDSFDDFIGEDTSYSWLEETGRR